MPNPSQVKLSFDEACERFHAYLISRRIQYDSAHAPVGGVSISGKFFPGGEFIPGEVMAKASPQEKAKVESSGGLSGRAGQVVRGAGSAAGSADRTSLLERARQHRRGESPAVSASKGVAKLPSAATITPADLQVAADTPRIPHPTSDEDVARFVEQASQTPVYKAVNAKIAAIAADSPDGNPTLWSLSKHAKGDWQKALAEHGHEAYEHIQWTPERKAIHDKILSEMLNPEAKVKPGERPKAVILIGPPGSGKTMAGQPEASKLGVKFTTINADDVKGKLPEYQGYNAAAVHEESSLLAEGPLTHRAISENHHVLMDLTGANQKKLEGMAEEFHKMGYELHLISIALPAYKSTGRAWDRFVGNAFGHSDPTGKKREFGRFVPLNYVHQNIDGKPEEDVPRSKG